MQLGHIVHAMQRFRLLRVITNQLTRKIISSQKTTQMICCFPEFVSLTLVFAAGRPKSYLRFLRMIFRLPPVARRLCKLSRLIPERTQIKTQTISTWYTWQNTSWATGSPIWGRHLNTDTPNQPTIPPVHTASFTNPTYWSHSLGRTHPLKTPNIVEPRSARNRPILGSIVQMTLSIESTRHGGPNVHCHRAIWLAKCDDERRCLVLSENCVYLPILRYDRERPNGNRRRFSGLTAQWRCAPSAFNGQWLVWQMSHRGVDVCAMPSMHSGFGFG